jgi:hypothetical protein
MARAKHRGTGPKPNRNKITIGDGTIRDLAYWLIGGDVSVKRGGKKASSSTVREEFKETIPHVLNYEKYKLPEKEIQRRVGARNIPASYYDPLTDYTGKYSPRSMAMLKQNQPERNVGYDWPKDVYGQPKGEFGREKSLFYKSPMYRGRETAAGDRRALGPLREPTLQPRPTSPTAPSLDRSVPLMGRGLPPAPRSPRGQIPEGDQFFGDEYGAGASMGGPVKRRKKKTMRHGGKIKKYAKGGGIRRAKY